MGEGKHGYLLDGKAIAPDALQRASPICAVCNQPALTNRLAVSGLVLHYDCFTCAHCKEVIGERRFVWHDEEPYLDGCYQKLFGGTAEKSIKSLLHEPQRRYALWVPLQSALGPSGLANFMRKHSELLTDVKRELRERCVSELHTFMFQAPAVAKPALLITFSMPSSLNAREVRNLDLDCRSTRSMHV